MQSLSSLRIDHIGVAVANLDDAISYHQKVFGGTIIAKETLTDRGIKLAFLECANTRLEFIAPINPSDESNTIAKFLLKRGSGLHHICYEVKNIKAELLRLSECGAELIDAIPRPGALGTQIAFIKPDKEDGLLIELCEY